MSQGHASRQEVLVSRRETVRRAGPVCSLASLALAAGALAAATARAEDASPAGFAPPAAFLEQHCLACHAGAEAENGFDLAALGHDLRRPEVLSRWVRVYDRVARGEMPPAEADPPPPAERTTFLGELETGLVAASRAQAHTVLRRLNRVEYEHTLHDLLGVRTELREMLPEDGKAEGFDNVGEALDISAVQLERYIAAAGLALTDATCRGGRPETLRVTHRIDAGRNEEFVGTSWHRLPDGMAVFFNGGQYPAIVLGEFRAPHEGRYRVRFSAATYQSETPITFAVYAGAQYSRTGKAALLGYLQATPGPPQPHEVEAYFRVGDTVRLMPQELDKIPSYGELRQHGPAAYKGPGLAVGPIEIEGPLIDEWPTRGHRLLFDNLEAVDTGPVAERTRKYYRPRYEIISQAPEADVERLLRRFVPQAFRRPVSDEQLAPYLALARSELAAGVKFEDALRTATIAVLCAPDFLFLREPEGKLDEFALAARLSYFLWSSLPDEELRSLAAAGRLSDPEVLRAQTERLLADPRAARFTRNFVGQWLNLREIEFTIPDKQLYPEYDGALLDAMVRETELFFDEVLRNNRPLHEFVDSDWTMLNDRLARHYRIADVRGPEFRRVALRPEDHRGGVLTHASVLKVSANGTTTSPVVRGAWVLERILNQPAPPPPPGVPGVEPDIRGATTLREQLDKHRAISSCNNCHKIIDPPGFALESYDVMGGWREHYRVLDNKRPAPPPELTGGQRVPWRVGLPVDPSGVTADGQAFRDLADYKRLLLADRRVFARALAEKLLVYGSGRALGFADRPEVERVVATAEARDYGFRELVHAVVQSSIFRNK